MERDIAWARLAVRAANAVAEIARCGGSVNAISGTYVDSRDEDSIRVTGRTWHGDEFQLLIHAERSTEERRGIDATVAGKQARYEDVYGIHDVCALVQQLMDGRGPEWVRIP